MKKLATGILILSLALTLCACGEKATISGYYEISSASYQGLTISLDNSYLLVNNQDGNIYSSMRIDQGSGESTYFSGHLQELSTKGSSIQYKFWIDEMIGTGFKQSKYFTIDYNSSKNTIEFVCDPLECTFAYAEVQKTKSELADELIASIGTITRNSENAVNEAELAVSLLADSEKDALENLDSLLKARSELDDILTLEKNTAILFGCEEWATHDKGKAGVTEKYVTGYYTFHKDGTGYAILDVQGCDFTWEFIDCDSIKITYDAPKNGSIQFDFDGNRLQQSNNSDVFATQENVIQDIMDEIGS